MTIRLRHGLFLGLLGAAVATACGVKLDQTPAGENPDAECLELFETCVELAGTSQGCEELYQHCDGGGVGTGGVEPPDGCEQGYIDCLVQGGEANSCQPLLEACLPAGTDDTGSCDPMEPGCLDGTGIEQSDTGECLSGEPGCETSDPMECDARHQQCLEILSSHEGEGNAETCDWLLDACLQDDCETAVDVCFKLFVDNAEVCEELTGCQVEEPPAPDCDQLVAECGAQGIAPADCAQVFPEFAQCDAGPYQCDWYYAECESQFAPDFCDEGRQACEVGWLPEIFDCELLFPAACEPAGLDETSCNNGEASCYNGFMDATACARISLAENPYQWLIETAECNNWDQPM